MASVFHYSVLVLDEPRATADITDEKLLYLRVATVVQLLVAGGNTVYRSQNRQSCVRDDNVILCMLCVCVQSGSCML